MSVVDRQRVTFLARTRNVTQRMRPSSQARIKNMRVPSSLAIYVAAAELANDKTIRSDILAESLHIDNSLFGLLKWGEVNQSQKIKAKHLNQNIKSKNLTEHIGFDLPSRLAVCRALFP